MQDTGNNEKTVDEGAKTGNSSGSMKLSNKAMRIIRSQINAGETGDAATFVHRDFFNVNLPNITITADRGTFDLVNEITLPKLELDGIRQHLVK